jgi:type VI secretion system protein
MQALSPAVMKTPEKTMIEVRVALLERLSGAESRSGTAPLAVPGEDTSVVRSVVNNLRKILNSREGSAPAQPLYGLPSPNELLQGWPASRELALQAIRRCIANYEPRLIEVIVRAVPREPNQPSVSFQITARITGARQPISLTTSVGADGRVSLT